MTRYHQRMKLAWLAVLFACGCPHHGGNPRSYPEPSVVEIVDRLAKARDALTSFKADATMDYWLGDQRAKGDVLVMGKTGARVRFAAQSPAGDSTLAEMACDGTNFVYVDMQKNCVLAGPCDQHSIAQFFHIELAPDDFLHLALGTPPVIANPTGKVTWDADHGYERVELQGADGTQKLTIDMKDHRFDVIDSELVAADGKVRWRIANTDFVDVGGHHVPGKTSFKSPGEKEDLLVDWAPTDEAKQFRTVDEELPQDKFVLVAPAGLPHC